MSPAIGISCNSRVLGIAAINSGYLATYQVKLFLESWSEQKSKRMVQFLSEQLPADATNVAIVIPMQQYASARVKAIIGHIKRLCEERGLTVVDYSQVAIQTLCSEARAKKKLLMHKLSHRYPELTYFFERELRNKQPYYIKLFEAVAAAMHLERESASTVTT